MGLWSRIRLLFNIKASSALDRAEALPQVLNYAYNQQQEQLRKLRQGLVEVATSKRRLEQQSQRLVQRIPLVEDQARRALAAEREDLARMALQRKQTALSELTGLRSQIVEVAEEESSLAQMEQQLGARIEEFKIRKEVMTARYSAAEAQVKVNESLSGVSGDLADLSMALGRAEEKTHRMLARASAIDALIGSGALAIAGGDAVERELRGLSEGAAVERELAALKRAPAVIEAPAIPGPGEEYGGAGTDSDS